MIFSPFICDSEFLLSIIPVNIVITKDINILRTRLQFELCQNHDLGVFFVTMQKGLDRHWEIVKTLINNWEEVIRVLEKESRPFAYRIKQRGKMEKI